MQRPFIFTSLGIVKGEPKPGNRKCGPENNIKLVTHILNISFYYPYLYCDFYIFIFIFILLMTVQWK